MPVVLYDFQQVAFNDMRAQLSQRAYDMRRGKATRQLRILLVGPCGSGKGTQVSAFIEGASAKGTESEFWVNRRNLVNDMAKRLTRLGIPHGVTMGNDPRARPWEKTHVCSADTLRNRPSRNVGIVLVDECHFSMSPTYQRLINGLAPRVVVIGLTATPILLNGDGLGKTYDVMIEMPKQSELVQRGFLTPTVTVGTGELPDFEGCTMSAGDFKADDMAARCNKPKFVGDVVDTWHKWAYGLPSVAFGANRAHAHGIMEAFKARGIAAAYVDAHSSDDERLRADSDLRSGSLKVLCNVGITSYGWDVGEVACVINGRRTMSLAMFIQSNRGTRITPGKKKCIFIDHVANTKIHGWVDDDREWSLGYAEDRLKRATPEEHEESVIMCVNCGRSLRVSESPCPSCGFVPAPRVKKIETEDGELGEMKPPCICNKCKIAMIDADQGDPCPCGGSAKRAYVVKQLSKDPEIAALQKTAMEKGYAHGWLYMQMQKLNASRSAVGRQMFHRG